MSEPAWQRVVKLARLQRESRYVWTPPADESVLLLAVPPGAVYAVSSRCPHQNFSLERGAVDFSALTVTCPLHRWVFSLATGAGVDQGGFLKTYATRVLEGWVWVCAEPGDHP